MNVNDGAHTTSATIHLNGNFTFGLQGNSIRFTDCTRKKRTDLPVMADFDVPRHA
jgi:hypothetical protein